MIRLRVPMIAKPSAKVVWFFEEEPISAGSDLTIETTDSYTRLQIQGAKRWHCGEFRVYAENEYGEDACSILVTVTCESFLQLFLKIAVYDAIFVEIHKYARQIWLIDCFLQMHKRANSAFFKVEHAKTFVLRYIY